jgi:predicted transcriptional regulator
MDQDSSAHSRDSLRELVAQVAAAYFRNSHVASAEIPAVISQIASSLSSVEPEKTASAVNGQSGEQPKLTRAQIRKSIRPEALISFEDGKSYKTLKRHLSTRGLSPEQYVQKWGLPADYPMVAPNYSAARSELARSLGLGQRSQQARQAPAKRRPGRRTKAAAAE